MKRTFVKFVKLPFALLMALSILMCNLQTVQAQVYEEDCVVAEFLEKKEAGLEVYGLLNDAGDIIGYYEPFSVNNPEPNIMPRYVSNINWTVKANTYSAGANSYTLGEGNKIYVKIGASGSTKSYIALYNNNTRNYMHFTSTESTNGWDGTITLGSGVGTDLYSFAIYNAGSVSNTYSGQYTI